MHTWFLEAIYYVDIFFDVYVSRKLLFHTFNPDMKVRRNMTLTDQRKQRLHKTDFLNDFIQYMKAINHSFSHKNMLFLPGTHENKYVLNVHSEPGFFLMQACLGKS